MSVCLSVYMSVCLSLCLYVCLYMHRMEDEKEAEYQDLKRKYLSCLQELVTREGLYSVYSVNRFTYTSRIEPFL